MLILTRRAGETVTIGDEVTFTILGIRGNQVRLGVKATDKLFRGCIRDRLRS